MLFSFCIVVLVVVVVVVVVVMFVFNLYIYLGFSSSFILQNAFHTKFYVDFDYHARVKYSNSFSREVQN